MIDQQIFFIPPEIEAGLASGDLIKWGGIVRNQAGQIVKHLKPIPLPDNAQQAAVSAATRLKNPRVLIVAAIIGTVAAGAAVVATARKRKKPVEQAVPECVTNYNASLAAYLEAVREGQLDADIIDRLISDLDAVMAYSDDDGSITLDFSTEQAAMLVQLVVDSTKQLAEDNSIDLDELQGEEPETDSKVVDLRRHLEVQRRIFNGAA